MRVLIYTQFYPPEMGAPQARLSDLARRLKNMGHEVDVLTAMPNYPTGRVFDGFGGFYFRDSHAGLSVHRCWIIPSNRTSFAHRILSYLSFCFQLFLDWFVDYGEARHYLYGKPAAFPGHDGLAPRQGQGSTMDHECFGSVAGFCKIDRYAGGEPYGLPNHGKNCPFSISKGRSRNRAIKRDCG